MGDMDMQGMMDSLIPMLVTWGTRIVGVLFLLWISFKIANKLSDSLTSSLKARDFDETLSVFFGTVVKWVIVVGASLACLSIFGIETTSFAAIIGAAGLAVGLAFQGTLSNFASGVLLLVFRPFKIGDVVGVAGQKGKIVTIGLFTTTMDTPDKRRLIIPNNSVAGAVIENVSHHPVRRFTVNVGVDYSASVKQTREILVRAVESVENVDKDLGFQIFLGELGDSAVSWQIRVFAAGDKYWDVYQDTVEAVKTHLDEAGIGIPYPTMDVNVSNS